MGEETGQDEAHNDSHSVETHDQVIHTEKIKLTCIQAKPEECTIGRIVVWYKSEEAKVPVSVSIQSMMGI